VVQVSKEKEKQYLGNGDDPTLLNMEKKGQKHGADITIDVWDGIITPQRGGKKNIKLS